MKNLKITVMPIVLSLILITGILGLFQGYAEVNAESVSIVPEVSMHPVTSQLQSQIVLTPTKDNTILNPDGTLSNGQGPQLFVGRTNNNVTDGTVVRGLLAFDIANNIPAGATIDSVSLRLNVSKAGSDDARTIKLFKLSADWGEGASLDNPGGGQIWADAQTNDATWSHRFFNSTTWATMGGDFIATPSSTQTVEGTGVYTWETTSQMVADVQNWLDDSASNYGWIIKMDDETTLKTAKQIDSVQNATAANRPMLIIDYTPAPSVPSLSLSKSADNSTPSQGDIVTYTIIAANTGGADATGAVVSDVLPDGLSLTGTITLDPPTSGTVGTLPTLVSDLGISAGTKITITFATVISTGLTTGTTLTNTASITTTEIVTSSSDIAVIQIGLKTLFLPLILKP